MSTPTSYTLTYQTPCQEETGCGAGDCLGKIKFEARPYNFCEDVTLQKDVTILGDLFVSPARISVGGQTFKPKTIVANNGTFVCLAV